MDDVKSFLASKTIWGAGIAILPQALSIFGIEVSAEDAQGIASHVDAIITSVGGLIAIYGRVMASKSIKTKAWQKN
ncbi:hypothetical protein SAMN04488105_110234 [Salipiger thiooxidans]|uniref:Holin n=1 Tax=Salipiger thiooxidans TaxID=282683 RepID=A0A1G7HDI6_9RHOB|nr:hypothetical protein [Salipiger thiooxidans]SDE98438.1 hypothetical protein SAMN04488105_110234 [Salipiger thiooxidans]